MDSTDKKIFEHGLAVPIGKAVSQWLKKNNIMEPVMVNAIVDHPSCYVDEHGVSHTGPLVVCNVHIIDEDEEDDDDI